jgi:hypothetical protein
VDRRIGLAERVQWEQYEFHFAPMSGHTRFASLIGWEVDGKRFAHTGDQVFLTQHLWPHRPQAYLHNHVYRNGALLDGLEQSSGWLGQWRPHIVLTGHTPAIQTSDAFFRVMDEGARQYRQVHEQAMPLAADEAHFNVDSWGGWIWPWRVHLPQPGRAQVRVTVRNPLPREARMTVRLVVPQGWRGSETEVSAGARAEVVADLDFTAPAPCRRHPIAAELTVDGQPFGQVAEAVVTVGHPRW